MEEGLGETQRRDFTGFHCLLPAIMAGMNSPIDYRVDALEAKAAFADDLLDALNTTVYRQQQQIDRLLREMRELREQLAAAAPAEARSLRDEVPPHY
ncbi:MAG TPA: SlyX family protein [Burkholderiales bacterium]|nr:SlyX family protein [Burkholderiales bacterium]